MHNIKHQVPLENQRYGTDKTLCFHVLTKMIQHTNNKTTNYSKNHLTVLIDDLYQILSDIKQSITVTMVRLLNVHIILTHSSAACSACPLTLLPASDSVPHKAA